MINPKPNTLEATCRAAKEWHDLIVEHEAFIETARAELGALTQLAHSQAVKENPDLVFSVGDVVQDDMGVIYRLTNAYSRAEFPKYRESRGSRRDEGQFASTRFIKRHYEGIMLKPNGVPAWTTGRSITGKLVRVEV